MFTYSALLKYSGVPHLTTKNSLGRPFRRTTNPMAHSSYLFFFLVLFGIPFVVFALTFLPDSSCNSDPGSHISRPFYPLPTAVMSRLFSSILATAVSRLLSPLTATVRASEASFSRGNPSLVLLSTTRAELLCVGCTRNNRNSGGVL